MGQRSSTAANALIQATIFKKCDRAGHRPASNKQCANGTCQHTCEPAQAESCTHKWTVRYSVNSRQREQSFETLTEAQTFQLKLSTDKQTQGAMFTDPKAGNAKFLPLCGQFISGMAKASENSKKAYRSNFNNPEVTKVLQGKSVAEAARMDAEVKTLLNKTLGHLSDDYRGNVRRIITGMLDEAVRRGTIPRHALSGIELAPRIVTAEQYEAENKPMVFVSDDTVRILVEGIIGIFPDKLGRYRPRDMAACASRRGCSARWDCGSGKRWGCASPISRPAATAPATCTCAGRPAGTARRWSRSSTARPATSGTCPYRTWCGTWCKPC
jgi:hypothetical protein